MNQQRHIQHDERDIDVLKAERTEAMIQARALAEDLGINPDWNGSLHMADVIEKKIGRPLSDRIAAMNRKIAEDAEEIAELRHQKQQGQTPMFSRRELLRELAEVKAERDELRKRPAYETVRLLIDAVEAQCAQTHRICMELVRQAETNATLRENIESLSGKIPNPTPA